jgi:hypothetical protein
MDVELTQFTHKSEWVLGSTGDYEFEAKHYDEPSEYGINFGRTSKLGVTKDNELIIRYDRGWDIEPETVEQNEILNNLIDYLDTLPKRIENGLSL